MNEIIPVKENLTASAKNLITNVDKCMKILFPNWGKKNTLEEVK
jgi:hypothetical protein